MKSCYADETLNISKEDFEAPEDLSIVVDCSESTGGKTIISDDDLLNEEVPEDLEF